MLHCMFNAQAGEAVLENTVIVVIIIHLNVVLYVQCVLVGFFVVSCISLFSLSIKVIDWILLLIKINNILFTIGALTQEIVVLDLIFFILHS